MTQAQMEQPRVDLQFNPADARKLFERLDHIHLVAILPDAPKDMKPHGKYFGSDVEAALAWAANVNRNGWGVYWTLNYVGASVGTKPKKTDIQAARGAHCDLDPPKDGGAWDKAEKVDALTVWRAPPSLIIDSGNGVQPVWLLDSPANDWREIEATNLGIRDTFGGDDCHNIDRLLRVPGSVNFPNRTKRERGCLPCMASWVQEDTGQRYRPDELARAFPVAARREPAPKANDDERPPTETGALMAAILRGENWHNNMLRLTAHLVAKGRTTVEILAMADCLTLDGYSVEETREDMRGMIEDARRKWDYAEPDDKPVSRDAAGDQPGARRQGVTLSDFRAYMPSHQYIFMPSGELWPSSSVNSRIPPLPLLDRDGNQMTDDKNKPKFIPAAAWLDQHKPVEQLTWAPGQPQVVEGRLISDGGWISRPGCSVFNLYRPPCAASGDATKANPWVAHIRRVYPNDAAHIIAWLAHRAQRPHEKINHALVLGGNQGIGKDTILEPVKHAIGPWNFSEVSPGHMLGRFNGFVKSVILRVSEARDLGDVDRFAFYDHMKTYTAAPPDVLRVDEKHVREYSVFNVCGVIITTNHKADGIFLPADDRRHYVAWSDLDRDTFPATYWNELYGWYADGGISHVVAYLRGLDLSGFDPKAPPLKTAAFWDIVASNQAPEDAELADALDNLGHPSAVTVARVAEVASDPFAEWLRDRRNSRRIPHRFEECGYVAVRNPGANDGMFKVGGKRCAVYARKELPIRSQIEAASCLLGR